MNGNSLALLDNSSHEPLPNTIGAPHQHVGLCPDLVVELVSPSDEGNRGSEALRRKMAAYLTNGARLGEPAEAMEGGEWLPGLGWSWRRSGRVIGRPST
jgi:hypothetical protein